MELKCIFLATATLMFLAVSTVAASQATGDQQQFDTMVEQAKVAVQNMTEHVRQMFGLPEVNTNETVIVQTLVNQTKQISNQVQDFMKKAHTVVNDKDGFLAPLFVQLNNTVNNLQTADLQKQANNLQDVISQSMTTIMDQMGKVATEMSKEAQPSGQLYQIAANTTEKLIEITRNYEKKIHETVKHEH